MFFRKKDEMEIKLVSGKNEISPEACLKSIIASLLQIIGIYAKEGEGLETSKYKQQLRDISVRLKEIEDIFELNQLKNDLTRLILRQKEAERIYDEKRISELKEIIRLLMKALNKFLSDDKEFSQGVEKDILRLEGASRLEDIRLIKQELFQVVGQLQERLRERQSKLEKTADELAVRVVELQEKLSQMTEEALIDETTRLFNRRALMRRLDEEIARFNVTNIPFSLVIFDVDHFKRVNDEHNHLIGDKVLYMVGRIAKETFRADDFVARMAGDEFAAMLFGSIGTDSWHAVERLRSNIAKKVFKYERDGKPVSIKISISAGVAWVRSDDTPETILERADKAMYLAKQRGRDQVVPESELKEEKG
ncbi:TPA: GGDEF domain-containing protein [Candidatus Poribacteria bacterium]|nr:GGDEF domain-containing protein [Candidatus Poribacteria bacterium]HEX29267.1 GGDEF domain-containing protein [Candidatus Poribacteria bacterium]